jgi:Glycosyl transferase family 2
MPAHLLSVVLPTHDRPEQLERAARSVLDQRPGEVELLIVDDASSPGTLEVLDRLAGDPRVRVLRNEASLGPGGSRNRGIAAATGDLLSFCDDDDAWLPGAAAAVLDRFEADTEVGVVTSWHRVVHDRTGRTALFRGPLQYEARQLLWFDFVAIPFGVIRRPMFPDDLAVDVGLRTGEDWDLWLRCAQTRPIVTLPQALYAYHQHGGERVTREGSGPHAGRQAFIDKHGQSMTPACRIYHQLVLARLAGGRRGIADQLAACVSKPVSTALAASVLAAGLLASDVGTRRQDPGLPARMMRLLLKRASPAERGGGTYP